MRDEGVDSRQEEDRLSWQKRLSSASIGDSGWRSRPLSGGMRRSIYRLLLSDDGKVVKVKTKS